MSRLFGSLFRLSARGVLELRSMKTETKHGGGAARDTRIDAMACEFNWAEVRVPELPNDFQA